MYQYNEAEYNNRMQWYKQSRFGMFIHFGLYSIPARGEWVRSNEHMPEEDYMPFFRQFNPKGFDASRWTSQAKEAGMKYIVLTAKHHDGFCLFDSAYTDFKSTNTPFGRDIVREVLDAARKEGLKVGLYYSLLDWHHKDYPHFSDRYHPMRGNENYRDDDRHFENYIDYLYNQVRELCTNYGKLDLMWFDFAYDDMRGEKWKAGKLVDMVRSLQPGIIINNRLEASGEGYGSLAEGKPTKYHGDFITPEKMLPPEGIKDKNGKDLCWEACVTMNNSWGYTRDDHNYKSPDMVIKKLVECVSKGGNFLLNVGPDGNGEFPPEAVNILKTLGEWMSINGESIYGCGKAYLPKPELGRYTQNGNVLYLHLYENSLGPFPLMGVEKNEIQKAVILKGNREVHISASWVHSDYPDITFLDLGDNPILPDPVDTVIKIVLKRG